MFFPRAVRRSLPVLCALAFAGCGGSPQSYVDRGNRYVEAGQYADAAIQYQKAIQKDPRLGDAHYRLGLLNLKRNQPAAAYRSLALAADLLPANEEVLSQLGKLSLTLYNADPKHPQQLYEQATKMADKLIGMKPAGYDGNLLKGALSMADRKPAEAALLLQKAIAAKPGDPDAELGLARALAQDNKAQEATVLAQELVGKSKNYGPAYDFLYQQLEAAGKHDEAGNVLKMKVANNPKEAAYVVELARYYAVAQKPADVDATIATLIARPADFPDGRLVAGDFYIADGKPDVALQHFTAGLGSASAANRNTYRKRMVAVLASQKKWPEVYQQIDAILKDKPDDDDAKLMRALTWLDEGNAENLDRAITDLQALSKKRPNDAALHFQTGNALARKKDQAGALREWTAAAQANREYLPARYAMAQLYLTRGDAAQALKVSEEILAIAPREAQATLLHASCLTATGDYLQARAELKKVLDQFPQSPDALLRMGTLLLSEKKYKDAEETFRRIGGAPAKDPTVLALLTQALQGQNQGARAIQLLQDELKNNPNSPALRQLLGRAAAAAGKYDIAIEQFTQLAAANPVALEPLLALAGTYTAKGDRASALGTLEKAAQTDPKSVPASLLLAQAYVSSGRIDEAKARYRHILEIEPANANALNDLAYLMADSGENLDQALTYAQTALKSQVDAGLKASLTDTLGWIYTRKSMTDEAVQTFQRLVQENPGNATFHYHFGAALYQKGDKRRAREELQSALTAKPVASDEAKIRKLLAEL
jgi:tetratricopeptide (TPR) repeat protein